MTSSLKAEALNEKQWIGDLKTKISQHTVSLNKAIADRFVALQASAKQPHDRQKTTGFGQAQPAFSFGGRPVSETEWQQESPLLDELASAKSFVERDVKELMESLQQDVIELVDESIKSMVAAAVSTARNGDHSPELSKTDWHDVQAMLKTLVQQTEKPAASGGPSCEPSQGNLNDRVSMESRKHPLVKQESMEDLHVDAASQTIEPEAASLKAPSIDLTKIPVLPDLTPDEAHRFIDSVEDYSAHLSPETALLMLRNALRTSASPTVRAFYKRMAIVDQPQTTLAWLSAIKEAFLPSTAEALRRLESFPTYQPKVDGPVKWVHEICAVAIDAGMVKEEVILPCIAQKVPDGGMPVGVERCAVKTIAELLNQMCIAKVVNQGAANARN